MTFTNNNIKKPNFKQIYIDLINKKCPEKYDLCENFFLKKQLHALDILKINAIIFDDEKNSSQYRAYKKEDILNILDYQQKNRMTNMQLAAHFKLSRNTVTKWKKFFSAVQKKI